jgi:divalent metal cation (Fe/Co/Zn/Cd) transporter
VCSSRCFFSSTLAGTMLHDAQTLFFRPLRNKEHRRRQHAAAIFTVLWLLSIAFTITTSFLLISVQALVLLNTAASLIASVITQSLCSRAGATPSYPFTFGFYRLSTVIRLGGIVFLVFGCLTTIVESLHRGMHVHHSNPYYLFCMGSLQLVFQVAYRREVRVTDRVTGHHGMAGAQSEDILYHACATSGTEGRGAVGGGDFFKTGVDVQAAAVTASPTSLIMSNSSGSGSRSVHDKMTALALYLLCPAACMAVSIVMMIQYGALADTVGALLLAGYYGYTGYHEGKEMLDLLMNKCVTDHRRHRSLERCLRNVKMLDGVLQVQSAVWWNVNAADSMLLVRIRLMSGCDACAVSQAVRRHLADLATQVYVECFPASGTDGGIGDGGSPLSWGSSVTDGHGHSHDHRHSHGCENERHHTHNHEHAGDIDEEKFGNAARRSSASTWGNGGDGADSFPNGLQLSSPGHSAPASPYGLQGYAPTGTGGERPTVMSFPAPPPSSSSSMGQAGVAGCVPRIPAAEDGGSRRGQLSPQLYPPQPVAFGNINTNNSRGPVSGYPAAPLNVAATSSAPLSPFPPAPSNPYGMVSGVLGGGDGRSQAAASVGDARYGRPAMRSAASSSAGFPLPPSPARLGDVPPPVFTPFRPAPVDEGGNTSFAPEFV